MKQYWIARLPPGFLLKRKKPWNSTDMGDRGRGRTGQADTPHSNEMAEHWGLVRDWWVFSLWKMLWEAFVNYPLSWEHSTPWELYPSAQTPVPAAPCALAALQGETQKWPKRPWCHWVRNHFCSAVFAWTLAACSPAFLHTQLPLPHGSCWHGWGAGLCHLLSAPQGHPWEQGRSLPLGLHAGSWQLPRWQEVSPLWRDAVGFSTSAEHCWNAKHLEQMWKHDKAPCCP